MDDREWRRSRRDHPAGREPGHDRDRDLTWIPADSEWFDESDWAALGNLLETFGPSRPPPLPRDAASLPDIDPAVESAELELSEALERFERRLPTGYASAASLINPLLDLWALARDVGVAVAAPLEQLLSVLVVRGAVSREELAAVAQAARTGRTALTSP